MGITVNGPSGIDTASIIEQLVELEYSSKVAPVEEKIDAYQVKIDAYSKLQSLLDSVESSALKLDKADDFNLFKTASSDDSIVTINGSVGAVEGTYDIGVYSLAAAEKMISTNGLVTSQTDALSSFGVTPGDISINGVSITIDADDTIQDMRMKINNATDADGNKVGVRATVLKVSETNFRLLLSSSEEGVAGAEYQDITGSTLQNLGIIMDAAGTKGTTTQKLQSAVDVQSAFAALAEGETIAFAGTDHNGNAVQNVFIKSASNTIDDFLAQIEKTYHGMVDASIDAGALVIEDKIAGSSQLTMSSFAIKGVSSGVNIATAGQEGAGVLTAGADAFYSIDGIMMQADSNSPEGVIAGVTLDLNKTAVNETVRVSMERDFDGVIENITDFFNQFNAIIRFANENTRYTVTEDEDSGETTVSKGSLAGDMTVRGIVNQFRTIFHQQFTLAGGDFDSLALIGVKTDPKTGEISVDADKLRDALEEDFDSTTGMFITKGYSASSTITLGRYTNDTQAGRYILEEVDADHLRMRLESGTEWYTSDARVGDVVNFSNGPVKGLSLAASPGVVGAGTTFTFSKGLADQMRELSAKLTDGKEGLISMRQETWRQSIDRAEDRISRLESSIEDYRLRLVSQFSTMEQNMSNLQTQSSGMMSALGYYN